MRSQTNLYMAKVHDQLTDKQRCRINFAQAYVICVTVLSLVFYHFLLPAYYVLVLHAAPPADAKYFDVIYYFTCALNEIVFTLLMLMGYVLHILGRRTKKAAIKRRQAI